MNNLIVKKFYWKKHSYEIKDIQNIKDFGDLYLFRKIPFGIGAIELSFKDGERLNLFALSDHSNFLREIRSRTENN